MSKRKLLIAAVEWMHELKYVWADARDSGDWVLLELIADINKIEQLLTQPEPSEDKFDRVKTNRVFYQEGYAQAVRDLKREPLSDEEIYMMILGSKYPNNWEKIKAFARAIEKAHGIGGKE